MTYYILRHMTDKTQDHPRVVGDQEWAPVLYGTYLRVLGNRSPGRYDGAALMFGFIRVVAVHNGAGTGGEVVDVPL
jgi:hypothetical protein